VGYWGTIVVARTSSLLAHHDDVALFGYQHRRLRDLGGDWQMLETKGWDDPPDLAVGTSRLAASTGAPVLAAYVCSNDCAGLQTATPAGASSLCHIPDVTSACGTYLHRPEPYGRDVDTVAADLTAWGENAGLSPSIDAIRQVVTRSDPHPAQDRVFDLVVALGVERFGEPRPYAFPIDEPPFSRIVYRFGVAEMARSRAVFREVDGAPEEPWETEAIALEMTLWSSVYNESVDVASLRQRAEWTRASYRASRAGTAEAQ
jgi:hypothetical protein